MKEADEIYVLDTGSSDNSVFLLKKLGIRVYQEIINPWRFDVARNKSLELLPSDCDICVCTDLDEVFMPGWRVELEKKWMPYTTKLKYTYNWSIDDNGRALVSFLYEKIHSRQGYRWVNPVHEVLSASIKEIISINEKIILNHYPDCNKSRKSYLPLLELSVKENPNNDRNLHYLGREYMYYHKWNKCIDTLIKHLKHPNALWHDERCASMRFIARSYINLKRYDEALMWYDKAIKEASYLREPYIEKAFLEYNNKNWIEVIKLCRKALRIKVIPKTYINEVFCLDDNIYDLLSIAYYYQKDYKKAFFYIKKAYKINPTNKHIKNNYSFISEIISHTDDSTN